MKYLIFGRGMIGNKFDSLLNDSHLSPVDITDFEAVKKEIQEYGPEVVINCAGKTGKPNVDWCEDHKLETIHSNVMGPFVLVRACQELSKYLVQVDSGCVYEGDNNGRGFTEEDEPNFTGSFYSKSKIMSQRILREFDNVLILRLRMPVLSEPDNRNYITKILRYPKIINNRNSITILDDFLVAAKCLMENKKTGIYNIVNPGSISPKEILDMYKEIVDPTHEFEVITAEELDTITKARRSNCILNSDKLEKEIKLKPIQERIRDCLIKYKEKL